VNDRGCILRNNAVYRMMDTSEINRTGWTKTKGKTAFVTSSGREAVMFVRELSDVGLQA
jgi:hypothetical protein